METFQVNAESLRIIFRLLSGEEKDNALAYLLQLHEELQEIRLHEKLQEETDKTMAYEAERLILNRIAGQLAANIEFRLPGHSSWPPPSVEDADSSGIQTEDYSYESTDADVNETSEEIDPDRNRLTCCTCGFIANNRKALYRHGIRLIHQTKTELENEIAGLHACTICNYSTNKRFNFERHLQRAHFGLKNIPCPKCGQCFKDKDCLRNHTRRIHNTLTQDFC